MKNYLILSALLAFVPATAQTSLGDYRQAVKMCIRDSFSSSRCIWDTIATATCR